MVTSEKRTTESAGLFAVVWIRRRPRGGGAFQPGGERPAGIVVRIPLIRSYNVRMKRDARVAWREPFAGASLPVRSRFLLRRRSHGLERWGHVLVRCRPLARLLV